MIKYSFDNQDFMIKDLSEKEWLVFNEFLRNDKYLAYPAKLERDLYGGVSRVSTSKICKKLEQMGFLKHEMHRPPRQKNDTEHYKLDNSRTGFIKMARFMLNVPNFEDRIENFSYPIFRKWVTRELVIDVLQKKEVKVKRYISINQGLNKDPSWILELNSGSFDPSLNKGRIGLDLPILDCKLSHDYMSKTLKTNQMAKDLVDLNKYGNGIIEHYEIWQESNIILPILGLISISPEALRYFLFGEWKQSNIIEVGEKGFEEIEHLLFQILFLAIGDLAKTNRIPDNRIIQDADFRPRDSEEGQDDAILRLYGFRGGQISYDAGFSTIMDNLEDVDFGDEGQVMCETDPIPKNCWVEISVKISENQISPNTDVNDYFLKKI